MKTALAVADQPEAKCAYDKCQAGGTILAGAPRVRYPGWKPGHGPVFHPGCRAAQQFQDRSS